MGNLILTNENFEQKNALTFSEALAYTGLSRSYMYKLTASRRIPHYKPHGKLLYFNRAELDGWMLQCPLKTDEQLEAEALQHMYSDNTTCSRSIRKNGRHE